MNKKVRSLLLESQSKIANFEALITKVLSSLDQDKDAITIEYMTQEKIKCEELRGEITKTVFMYN